MDLHNLELPGITRLMLFFPSLSFNFATSWVTLFFVYFSSKSISESSSSLSEVLYKNLLMIALPLLLIVSNCGKIHDKIEEKTFLY
jgi:hypothetical protein